MEVFPSCRARATRSSWPRAVCRAAARPLALRAPPASPSGGRPAGGSPTRAREDEHKVSRVAKGCAVLRVFCGPPGPVARAASYPGDCHDPHAGDATISKVRRGSKCGSRFTAFPGELRKVIAPSFPFRTAPVFRFCLFRFGGCSDLSLAVPPRISRRCLVNQPGLLSPLSPSGGQHRLVPIFSVRSLSAAVSRIRSSAPLKPHSRWLCAAHLGCPRISPQPWVVQRTPWFGAATYGLEGWPADNRG
jgi:hypothetical protein